MNEDYVFNTIKMICEMNDGVPEGALMSIITDMVITDLKQCINNLVTNKKIRYNKTVNHELIFYCNNDNDK